MTNINETIDSSVFVRWRADAQYRPRGLRNWAKLKKVDRKVQMLFNLVMIFISYVLILNIQAVKPKSKDGLALQSLSILLLTSMGIMLPMFYTIVFGLVVFGQMSLETAQGLGDQTAIEISGAVGAVAAILNALKGLRKATH